MCYKYIADQLAQFMKLAGEPLLPSVFFEQLVSTTTSHHRVILKLQLPLPIISHSHVHTSC